MNNLILLIVPASIIYFIIFYKIVKYMTKKKGPKDYRKDFYIVQGDREDASL